MYLPAVVLPLALVSSLPLSTAQNPDKTAIFQPGPPSPAPSPPSHLWGCARCIVPDPDNAGKAQAIVDKLLSLTAHCAQPDSDSDSDDAVAPVTDVAYGPSPNEWEEGVHQYVVDCLVKSENDGDAEERAVAKVERWEELCREVRLEGGQRDDGMFDGKRRNGYGFVLGGIERDLATAAQACGIDARAFGGTNMDVV